jgi:hypothetical protein
MTMTHDRALRDLAPPWHTAEVAAADDQVYWQITGDDYQTVIAVTAPAPPPGTTRYEAGRAVAHLLSAAPELYEALRLARTWLQQYEEDTTTSVWSDLPPRPRADWHLGAVLQEVEDALRKAKGLGW